MGERKGVPFDLPPRWRAKAQLKPNSNFPPFLFLESIFSIFGTKINLVHSNIFYTLQITTKKSCS
jgi:hypothetical protein